LSTSRVSIRRVKRKESRNRGLSRWFQEGNKGGLFARSCGHFRAVNQRSGEKKGIIMISQASNPRTLSEIAKPTGWIRTRVVAPGLAMALALGVSCAWGQENSNSSKKSTASDDFDLALDAFTSPDESLSAIPTQGPAPLGLNPGFLGTTGYFRSSRVGFVSGGLTNPLIPVVLSSPYEFPYSNGIPIAVIGPTGAPLGGSGLFGGSDSYTRNDYFDVTKQPSSFKYTGSEIDLFYGFSSNGASVRAAGFVTSIANKDTQIVVGASFSDQRGLTFPAGRYSPFGTTKYSAQTQQYFGAINHAFFGGAMVLGVDFAVADTKLNGAFRPINRANQAPNAVVNPNTPRDAKTYATQLNLSGQLPANLGYEVGLGFDQSKLSGNDTSDLRSLMTPRRR
jgi:hypothetical protein